jgi:TRAP-type C4-dicarboxylate transport system substrate-binding protein
MTTQIKALALNPTVILLFALFTAFLPRYTHGADPISWKLQSINPHSSDIAKTFEKQFVRLVTERSKGRLEIKWFPSRAVLGPRELFDGVSKGVVQCAASVGAYHSRKVPEAFISFGLPCNFDNVDDLYDFYYNYKDRAFLKPLQEAYHKKNVHLLASAAYGETFHTNFRLEKLGDINGKKIRAVGGSAHLAKALGAAAVTLPVSEQYMALQRGLVDGTLMSVQATKGFNLMEVTKYIVLPPARIGSFEIYCNLDALNKLPPDLRKIVEDAAVEAAVKICWPQYKALEKVYLNEAKNRGVEVLSMPKTDWVKMRAAINFLWEGAASKSPGCKKMLDIQKDYLRERGL